MATDVCVKCGGALRRADVGRPPSYCSVPCRRAGEFELRRLQRRLESLEDYAGNLRLQGHSDRGQTRRLQQEIATAEARLLALLAGHPEPERVSPP